MDPDDDFEDINITSILLDAHSHRHTSIWYFIREMVTFSVSVVAIVCNVFIVYASWKLKNLNTPKHFYLVSSSVMNIIALLLSPYVDFLAMNLMRETMDLAGFICATIQVEKVFMCFNCIFLIVLLTDWCLNNLVSDRVLLRYTQNLLAVSILLYLSLTLFLLYNIVSCVQDWHRIHHCIVDVIYMVLILYVLVVNCLRLYLERLKYLRLEFDFSLLIPTVSAVLVLPYFFIHYLAQLVNMTEAVHQLSYALSEGLFYSSAIANVCILSKHENGYREHFLDILECKCRDNEGEKLEDNISNGKVEITEECC